MWWRDIAVVRREEWFSEHVSRFVGDGKQTLFWTDLWIGGVLLRDRLNRLFDLSEYKELIVYDMCQLGWGEGGEAWRWWRRLLAWEEELEGELTLLLQNIILPVDKNDRWLWTLESSHVFSVRSAYIYITLQPPIASTVATSSLWHKYVPLKVVLCVGACGCV